MRHPPHLVRPPLFDQTPRTRIIVALILFVALMGLAGFVSGYAHKRAKNPVADPIQNLESAFDLRLWFELYGRTPRLILLLSPTDPASRKAAEYVQKEILNKYFEAEVYVLVVWYPALPSDAKDKWSNKVLTDRRVVHLWDQQKIIKNFFEKELPPLGSETAAQSASLADRYFIYGDHSEWVEGQPPTRLLSSGRGVIDHKKDFEENFMPLLNKQQIFQKFRKNRYR